MAEVAVLTATPQLPLYGELVEAGRELGVKVALWDANRMVARLPRGVFLEDAPLPIEGVAVFLPRVGNFRPQSTLALVEALQDAGVAPFNTPEAIRLARDHWATTRALALAGVPHVPTVAGSDPQTLARAAATLGFPVVVKSRRSRQGVGVVRCGCLAEVEAVLDALWRVGEEVVVQRFCPPGGVSYRVLVLEGEVLGVTCHRAPEGEFRSNAARGGEVSPAPLSPRMAELAQAAALACGLGFCGVDLFPDGEALVVGEVNPTPGWKHFAKATGIPVARRVVEAMAGWADREG